MSLYDEDGIDGPFERGMERLDRVEKKADAIVKKSQRRIELVFNAFYVLAGAIIGFGIGFGVGLEVAFWIVKIGLEKIP